jgi:hypothetical protein
VTHGDAYPIPNITETLGSLGDEKFFSKMNLSSVFYQVEIEEKDMEKTEFSTPLGSFEYNRMAMGLVGGPSTFQRLMYGVLYNFKGSSCFVYLDDIILFSSTMEQYVERLRDANLKIHPQKCQFVVDSIEYLGHIVSKEGVAPDLKKVKAIKNYPTPRSAKEVRSFLGFVGFYRRHIGNFANIARHSHR